MLSKEEEESLAPALAIISEHFSNYAIAVLTEGTADIHYDYSNWRVGRMLFSDSLEDMQSETGFEWEEEDVFGEDDDDDEDYY